MEIPKERAKKIKSHFLAIFQAKLDEIGREREKNISGPNSAATGPRQENSEKNSKKIQKI